MVIWYRLFMCVSEDKMKFIRESDTMIAMKALAS